ncbi:MAG: DciA family protein [Pseudomonadota bacterium]
MPLHKLGSFIGASAELKALTALARRLDALQSAYKDAAPSELARASRVKSLSAATLHVTADNAAVAAKLKQLAPSLLAAIRISHAEVTHLRINVDVSGRAAPRVYRSQKQALTPLIIDRLDELAGRVNDSGLKAALGRLARRHETPSHRSDEHQALEHKQNHDHDEQNQHDLKRTLGPNEVSPITGVNEKTQRNHNRE